MMSREQMDKDEGVRRDPIIIEIKDTSTGEAVSYEDELYSTNDYYGMFIWTEGNYSCDCNRHIFFDRAKGVEVDFLSHEDKEAGKIDPYPCSHGSVNRFIVKITDKENKEVLLDEFGLENRPTL